MCTNPFDQYLKDAAKRDEDLLKRTTPIETNTESDKALLEKMKLEIEKLRRG